ncbi:MAG: glycosyltransferase family 9 protein, partial [Candidatus Omnitrophica bacterium]|nr:glycosyltransferase family 9 protein [Candidatus Omnitrophota bacterium]
GVRERIGYATKGRTLFLTKAVPEPQKSLHHVNYFLELLKQSGLSVSGNASYRFYFSGKDKEQADALLKNFNLDKFAAFHLGANWEPKRWPPQHFARLADLIFEKWGLAIVVTGAPEDESLFQTMMAHVKKARVISLIGKTNLTELAALYEQAGFMVSGDSGPMHIAAGVGIPVITLFGPTSPELTGPRGFGETAVLTYVPKGYTAPWYEKNLPSDGWLSHISPEEVFHVIEEKGWANQKGPGPSVPGSKVPGPFSDSEAGDGISNPRHILVVTLSNLGDVILTTAVMSVLHRSFPDAKMTVVVGPRSKAILERCPFIGRIVVYDKRANLKDKWKFLRELWRGSYDWVVDLRNTAIPFMVPNKKRSPLLRFHISDSMRERHLEVLRFMGVETWNSPPFIFFTPQDETSALEKLKADGIASVENCILVACVAASELKTWRLAGYEKVIEGLMRERSEEIILVGGQRERPMVEPLVKMNPRRIHNMAGKTTYPELSALISKCALVLTNDSSVMHIAHELNRPPVVAIFGPTNPIRAGRLGPRWRIVREEIFCSPCDQPRCRFERQACFEDLSPQKVLDACLELLQKKDEALSHQS